MTISGYDCWKRKGLSRRRKLENVGAETMYGTCSQGISQIYLHTPSSSDNGMNHTRLCLPSRSWYSFTNSEGWKTELAGWLYTEINVWHREMNMDMVAHLSTNRARRRLTLLIEANALTTTPLGWVRFNIPPNTL